MWGNFGLQKLLEFMKLMHCAEVDGIEPTLRFTLESNSWVWNPAAESQERIHCTGGQHKPLLFPSSIQLLWHKSGELQ